MKKLLIVAAALLAVIIIAKPGRSAKEPIKIGAIFTFTGNQAPLGLPEKQTVEMIRDEVNAKGGINGSLIELFVYDDEGDATKAKILAKKLIEKDQVVGIVGPTISPTSLAIIDDVEKAQIPNISCAASIKIVDPVKKWVFKTAQSDRLVVEKLYTYFKQKGITKIAILTVKSGYGASGKGELNAMASKFGITIVADETFGESDTDMTTQLTKIKTGEAKAIICWGTNPGPARIAKGMKQLGMTIPLFQSHGVANPQFIEQAEGAAEGNMLFASRLIVAEQLPDSDASKKKLLAYKKAYEAKYGAGKISTFGGHAYDAMWMMVDAVKRAGSADKAKVRDEIEKTRNFIGMTGVFNLSATDHMGLSLDALVPIVVKDGKWKLIK